MSRVTSIHRGRYHADMIVGNHGGLCVTMPGKRGGTIIRDASKAELWRHEISTALDAAEADTLCRAIWQSSKGY